MSNQDIISLESKVLNKTKLAFSTFTNELLYGGHILSLGSTATILTVILLAKLPINWLILLIPYLSSQVIYSYNHLKELSFDLDSNPERTIYIQNKQKTNQISLLMYALLLGIACLFTNLYTFIFVLIINLGGILYTDYFKAYINRYLIGFKNIYTAFFWSISIFIVPLYFKSGLSNLYLYLSLFIFLRCIVNSTFFDLKDIKDDAARKIKTLATILGFKRTILALILVDLISIIPILYALAKNYLPKTAWGLTLTIVYGLVYLLGSLNLSSKNLRLISYVIVDAEFFFWPILVILARWFLK